MRLLLLLSGLLAGCSDSPSTTIVQDLDNDGLFGQDDCNDDCETRPGNRIRRHFQLSILSRNN